MLKKLQKSALMVAAFVGTLGGANAATVSLNYSLDLNVVQKFGFLIIAASGNNAGFSLPPAVPVGEGDTLITTIDFQGAQTVTGSFPVVSLQLNRALDQVPTPSSVSYIGQLSFLDQFGNPLISSRLIPRAETGGTFIGQTFTNDTYVDGATSLSFTFYGLRYEVSAVSYAGSPFAPVQFGAFPSLRIEIQNGQIGLGGVPEPATWAMFIVGFGLVGVSLRRRRAVRFGGYHIA
jgi:PEP-CTERM motif